MSIVVRESTYIVLILAVNLVSEGSSVMVGVMHRDRYRVSCNHKKKVCDAFRSSLSFFVYRSVV